MNQPRAYAPYYYSSLASYDSFSYPVTVTPLSTPVIVIIDYSSYVPTLSTAYPTDAPYTTAGGATTAAPPAQTGNNLPQETRVSNHQGGSESPFGGSGRSGAGQAPTPVEDSAPRSVAKSGIAIMALAIFAMIL